MGATTLENVWCIRRILRNMELLLGLRVNFEKCSLMGINVDKDRLNEMAGILGCRKGSILFLYLGIKVGCNHRRVLEWN